MEERKRRTTVQGVVTSKKNAKTITVTVSTERNHPLYQKRVGYSKKYYAHDENDTAEVGDTVTIMACRPISKLKRWRLVRIDKKAITVANVAEVEADLEKEEGVTEAAPAAEEAE
jgi:small subunit ribosomal protein S17